MKYSAIAISAVLAGAYARPEANTVGRVHARDVHVGRHAYVRPRWHAELHRREVPQEHSHEKFLTKTREMLNLNNPDVIVDVVFGLLGNAAGSAGRGKITDTDCLQQATADQAFTNAKAAGDVDGMTSALIYRALERNTGKVGLASVSCTAIKAVNSEIAGIAQHQDPASAGAAQINKNIAINLAIQINCIGGDATLALQSGTFAPGQIGDPTSKGNSCDDQNDAEGCIFTENLLVEDATVDEIQSAISGAVCGGGAAAAATAVAATTAANTAVGVQTDTAVAATTSVAAAPPAPAALPTECALAISTVTVTAGAMTTPASDAAPPPPMGQGQAAAPPPPMEAAIATSTSPNPMITALPPAGNAIQDCSAQIASALALAGFAGNATDIVATATASSALTVVVSPTAAPSSTNVASPGAGLDFGTCPNPTIVFADGFDGRNQPAFEAADTDNTTGFPHGSALNIKVITDFVCQQLQVKCKASAAVLTACASAAAAAQAAGGTTQAAADAFNAALGF